MVEVVERAQMCSHKELAVETLRSCAQIFVQEKEMGLEPQTPFTPCKSKGMESLHCDWRKILWDVNISAPAADSNSCNAICDSTWLDRLRDCQ